jgi:hypothetical protein
VKIPVLSSKKWIPYISFAIRLFVVSVGINYLWEMVQMPLYDSMSFRYFLNWLLCFRASLGDGVIILTIWGVGLIFFRKIDWYRHLNFWSVLVLVVVGTLIAVGIELYALSVGRWSYSALMPLVPPTGVGLSPLLQLLILPVFAMFIAGWWGRQSLDLN